MSTAVTIARATFHSIVRHPNFLLFSVGGLTFSLILANMSYFALGEEMRLVRQSLIALHFVLGIAAAALHSNIAIHPEIHGGLALTLLSKPVQRGPYLAGKFIGLLSAVLLQYLVLFIGALWATRMARHAQHSLDWLSILLMSGGILFSLTAAGVAHYAAHRPFAATASLVTSITLSLGFALTCFLDPSLQFITPGSQVDWTLLPAGTLIALALTVMCALALACSVRLTAAPTLLVCLGVFMAGLLSQHFFGRGPFILSHPASWLRAAIPDWQIFWIADLPISTSPIPSSHYASILLYTVLQTTTFLGLAHLLFRNRDLS